MRLTERFSRPDFDTLKYEVTVDDPLTYTRPWTAEWTVEWVDGEEIAEQFCEDHRDGLGSSEAGIGRRVSHVTHGIQMDRWRSRCDPDVLSAQAHHSFRAQYDATKPIEVTGYVTKIDWMNPHVYFYIDVVNEEGKTENWAFEMGPPHMLEQRGWKRNSMAIGDELEVERHARARRQLERERAHA